jgi:nucleoid-associated protein YgaU
VRRLLTWLGGGALAIAVVAFILWTNSTPPQTTESAPSQTSQPTPSQASQPTPSQAAPSASAPTAPSFDIVKVDPTGHAVIAGRAAPGAKVRVLDGDKKLGEITADNRGEWVLVPTEPMAPGERQLTLEATDPATGVKTNSVDTVALAVAAPSAGAPGSGTVAVLLPGNTNRPAQALQTPNAQGGSLSLDTAEYNAEGKLMLSGHASRGATLRLYAENQPLAAVTADPQGKWSSVVARPQASGKIELRIDQLAADGTVAQRIAEPFEAPAEATPTGQYTVERGNSLWVIARKAYGAGTHYTVIYSANREHIRDPNLIYPGQVIALPKS